MPGPKSSRATCFLGSTTSRSKGTSYQPPPRDVESSYKTCQIRLRIRAEDFETFFRKGEMRSCKTQITAEQNERFDRMIDHRFSGTGLTFRYE
jgi:hypothetical protein